MKPKGIPFSGRGRKNKRHRRLYPKGQQGEHEALQGMEEAHLGESVAQMEFSGAPECSI